MPTYEYECEKCGITFERFQSIKDEPIEKCPECAGTVKRLISGGAAVIFKGSGFYATDYRSESYKQEAKKEKGLSKTTDSKTSESKTSESKTSEKKSDKKSDKGAES